MPRVAIAAMMLLSLTVLTAQGTRPWRQDPVFQQIAVALADVPAIDNHSHLLSVAAFDPSFDTGMPLRLRSDNPEYAAVIKERLGLDWDPAHARESDAEGRRRRAARMAQLGGEAAYWTEYLDYSRTGIVLVNQEHPQGTNGQRLRWVPHATTLLLPLRMEALEARSPMALEDYGKARSHLLELLREDGLNGPPERLDDYLAFLGRQLARWKTQGAVALKFYDAYHRTLRFEEVPLEQARLLWTKGRRQPLDRSESLALQDHLAWEIFRLAGPLRLPVHIHSSHGAGPFLRLQESDVRNLENVLTDPRFFGTHFVLIHGGAPWHEAAAYLAANKAHVWIDLSAMPFLYSVPDLAAVIEKYLLFAPERTLFGVDAMGYFGTPVGAEFVHLALSRHLREALSLALAHMVRDGVVDQTRALSIGRAVLRENARRLYGI
jgi:predicted TIM-barrel fold metal-dependent hydrolase